MNKELKFKGAISLAVTLTFILTLFFSQFVYSAKIGDVGTWWYNSPFNQATYVCGRYNTTHWYAQNTTNAEYEWLSTDDDLVLQNAIDKTNATGGGIVYVKSGLFVANVQVKKNVLLILEPGAAMSISATVDPGGYCLKYSQGKAWFYQPLDMRGEELRYAAFHTGTSQPTSMSVGQAWFDTQNYVLKVYNGTDWQAVSGAQGQQGPPGQVEGLPFDYLVHQNATASYAVNGETGAIDYQNGDAANSIDWCIDQLTTGGTIYVKHGVSTTSTVTIDEMFISLISDVGLSYGAEQSGQTPYIRRIVLDASHEEIHGVRLEGLAIDELYCYASNPGGYSVRHNYVSNCRIKAYSTANRRGIILNNSEGSENASLYTDFLQLDNCYLYVQSQANGYGFITVISSAAFGGIFNNCHVHWGPSNTIFMLKKSTAKGGFVFNDCSWATGGSGQSNHTFFWAQSGSYLEVMIDQSSFEIHQQACMLKNVGSNLLLFDINDCRFVESSYDPDGEGPEPYIPSNLFLVNNSASASSGSIFKFHDNRLDGAGETHIGTLNGLTMELDSNSIDFVTENKGSASGTSPVTVSHGLGTPETGFTPDCVKITPMESGTGEWWVTSRTTASFKIYFNGGGTKSFLWEAEYDP